MKPFTINYNGNRIEFADRNIEKDKKMIDSIDIQINDWWKQFDENKENIIAYFKNQSHFDISEFMNNSLNRINPALMYEYGLAVTKKGYRLIITPESRKDLRPLTRRILQKAPKLDDWEFYEYRLPEGYDIAIETVKVRTGGKINDLQAIVKANEINSIDLTFIRRGIRTDEQRRKSFNDAFVALETIVGEEVLDNWIGSIDISNHVPKGERPIKLDSLSDFTKSRIKDIEDSLPPEPYFELYENAKWSVYTFEPQERVDYPVQSDMFIGTTMVPKAFICFHNTNPFLSKRFSKFNEVFFYVKIDEWQSFFDKDPQWKENLSSSIDSVLINKKIGTGIGSGTGRRYAYLDFACTNVTEAVQIIKSKLQKAGVSRRSWIQFYDSDLCGEWIGIWPDSPHPPMPDFEKRNK